MNLYDNIAVDTRIVVAGGLKIKVGGIYKKLVTLEIVFFLGEIVSFY